MALLGWGVLGFFWPNDWPRDPRWVALVSTVAQLGAIVLVGWVARRAGRGSPTVAEDHSEARIPLGPIAERT
jgi:hypothetical protein